MSSDETKQSPTPEPVDDEETSPYGAATSDERTRAPEVDSTPGATTPTSRMWKLKHPAPDQ